MSETSEPTAAELAERATVSVNVKNCARCGSDHGVAFAKFGRVADSYTHWGMCPITGEPVLMRFEDKGLAPDHYMSRTFPVNEDGRFGPWGNG